jgi:proteasome lid subunit RPN8/RPN11
MVQHALDERPRECCGILSGNGHEVRTIHRLENEAVGETEYLVAEGLIHPFKEMRRTGEELLAIYHSHPAAPALPSRKDLERNFYPETPHVIISLADAQPVLRAFLLAETTFEEIPWRTLTGS